MFEKISKKQWIAIASILILLPVLIYGFGVGYRLYRVYNTVYQHLDDEEFEPMDPAREPFMPLGPEEQEQANRVLRVDDVTHIWNEDNPIYNIRSPKDSNKLNILLIGTDLRDGVGGYRADTIMVVQFDKKTKSAGILSIPRDTYVKIPNRGYDKINHAYAFGGIKLLKDTVENYLDIHIDHYAQVGMEGFGAIIDTLGGIPVYVAHDMVNIRNGRTLFTKGHYHMDGDDVLVYVRARYLEVNAGDIARTQRQQQVMIIIYDEITRNLSLNRTLSLLESISPYLRTDITPGVVINYWTDFTNLDPAEIQLVTLQYQGEKPTVSIVG